MNEIVAIILSAVIAMLIFVWVYRNDRKKITGKYKIVPALLRAMSIFVMLLLLCMPFLTSKEVQEVKPKLSVLVDKSTSMKNLFTDSVQYASEVSAIVQKLSTKYDVNILGWGNSLFTDDIWSTWQNATQMSQVLQQIKEDHQATPIQGALIISDGISNVGIQPDQIAHTLPFPVHTLVIGDSTTPIDVGVQNVLVNKTVSLDARFQMLVDIFAHKVAGKNIDINVLHNGKTVYQQQFLIHQTQQIISLPLEFIADKKGLQKYTISIGTVDGEKNVTNNLHHVFVDVIDEKIELFIYTKGPHPDVSAIKGALEGLNQFTIKVSNVLTSAALAQADIVVALNPDANEMGILRASAKPIWYILGIKTPAQVYATLDLIQSSGNINGNVAVLPMFNKQFSSFQLTDNIVEVVSKYPPLQGVLMQWKSQSDVLLYQKIGNVQTQHPLWFLKQDGNHTSLILLGEGIWKWKMQEYKNFNNTESFQTIIKQSLLKIHSKQDKKPFVVYLDKQVYNTYERVNLYAMYKNALGELNNVPNVDYVINKQNEVNKMERIGNTYKQGMGIFEEGAYTVTTTLQDGIQKHTAQVAFEVLPFDLESVRTHADYLTMHRIASNSGGFFSAWQAKDAFIDLLLSSDVATTKLKENIKEFKLVDMRWLFFVLLVLMGGEWLFRKNYNI